MVGARLTSDEIEGVRYWFSDAASTSELTTSSPIALLPEFDEYVVAYKDSRKVIDAAGVAETHGGDPLLSAVVADSQVIGHWKPSVRGDEVLIAAELYVPLDDTQRRALHESASEYADFLGLRSSIEASVIAS